jgi:glycosyltransferase involved in cell wall biosynthesis
MKFHFICPSGLEPWDWGRPEGIAGSETCVIELSRRLARRGHDVRVYAPTFEDTTDDHEYGVRWRHVTTDIDTAEDGVWWLCRCPWVVDHFDPPPAPSVPQQGGRGSPRNSQRVFLRCDDVHYRNAGAGDLTKERHDKLDHILLMSGPHRDLFRGFYPFLDDRKTSTLGCGIATDRIELLTVGANHLAAQGSPHPPLRGTLPQNGGGNIRDPYRLVWVSSPDRGLDTAIDIFYRALEKEPRLNLHVYYGWHGVDRAYPDPNSEPQKLKRRIQAMDRGQITWHGRVGKAELWRGHLSSNIWLYPTWFPEAGVVSAQEAQALGAIPICPPTYGLAEKVKHGVWIAGNPADPVIRDRYVAAVLALVERWEVCESIRRDMMPWARREFDWERIVDHHENLAGCLTPQLVKMTDKGMKVERLLVA